jgi:hypothetical protein
MTKHRAVAALCSAMAAGCASTPDVTVNYYGVKWNAVATVTQMVACARNNTRLVALPAVSVATNYSSDTARPLRIAIKQLDGVFSDADFAMTLTDDGRLKTINQTSTGQGEAIVKSAVGLLAALPAIKTLLQDETELKECRDIDKWTGGKGPATLVYKATIDAAKLGPLPVTTINVDPAPESKQLHDLLAKRLPAITMDIGKPSGVSARASYPGNSSGVVLLELQKTAFLDLTVRQDNMTIGANRILVPTADTYQVPIPKAAFFGKQGFSLALSDAGAVTSIGYVKTSGSAGALNALASIAGIETSTATAKAAELKAQADVIAQQQRLIVCETKPLDCK